MTKLYEIANNNSDLVREWLNDWRVLSLDSASTEVLQRWYQAIIDKYTPQVIAVRPCITLTNLYETRSNVVFDSLAKCRLSSGCNK